MTRENSAVRAFRKAAACCQADAALACLMEDAAREIGFRYFALTYAHSLNPAAPRLRGLDNYPEMWGTQMMDDRRYLDDPVLHGSLRANCGFGWNHLSDFLTLQPRHLAVLADASRAGLRQGFTVPANVPFEPAGACSFATSSTRKVAIWQLESAELIGGHALQAARRLHGFPARTPAFVPLTPRETEVLYWAALGKSNGDIAAILGVTLATAKTHMASILLKLHVSDRTQAAVFAARWGIVVPGDVNSATWPIFST